MLTGLGVKFSIAIVESSGGNLIVALIIAMITCIILGMGLPPAPVYVLVGALIVPALISLGILKAAAHFFAMYYAVFSVLTPPVAVTVYAMAGILGANIWRAGWLAVKLMLPALIVPFIMVFAPEILTIGPWFSVAYRFIVLALAIYAFAIAAEGYLYKSLSMPLRGLFFTSMALLMIPILTLNIAGIAMLIALILFCKYLAKAGTEKLTISSFASKEFRENK